MRASMLIQASASWLVLSVSACASTDEGVRDLFTDVAQGVAVGFAGAVRAHPGLIRVATGLHCDRGVPQCEAGVPVMDRCALEPGVWTASFEQSIVACTLTCDRERDCIQEAADREVVDAVRSQQVADCHAAVESCDPSVETDACDALAGLAHPGVVAAVAACMDQSCDALAECLADALETR